jgi:hypothetical protein
MNRLFALAVCLLAGWPGTVCAQRPSRPAEPAAAAEAKTPGYDLTYCGGFITDRTMQEGLRVQAGEESGAKSLFVTGDFVYLNHGVGWIVNPGGEYMVLRPVKDLIKQEAFRGQYQVLQGLGTMYQEMGRLRVNIVHERSATAVVLRACDPVQVGDVCIPFNVKDQPVLRPPAPLDPFAPFSGKTSGIIAAGKGFNSSMGQRDVVYLDIGGKQGVAVGQYYRIYRPFNDTSDPFHSYSQQYPTHILSEQISADLTREQQNALPRDILGELVITWVEWKSATGLIINLRRPVYSGDRVELE